MSPTSGTLMNAKPFLKTYAKTLSLLTVLTLAVISVLYFTQPTASERSASHKPHSVATVPSTPSPATPPTRTASSFTNSHATTLDYVKPTHTGQPTPAAKPTPTPTKPSAKPTPTPAPTRTHSSGISVTVKLPVLPRVGISVSRSAPRTGSARTYARAVLSASQYSCLDRIITRESGWRVTARNPSSGAYGLGQALPGSKMASKGADWRTNGVTQIRWVISYVNSRYGSACSAWSFWRAHRYY